MYLHNCSGLSWRQNYLHHKYGPFPIPSAELHSEHRLFGNCTAHPLHNGWFLCSQPLEFKFIDHVFTDLYTTAPKGVIGKFIFPTCPAPSCNANSAICDASAACHPGCNGLERPNRNGVPQHGRAIENRRSWRFPESPVRMYTFNGIPSLVVQCPANNLRLSVRRRFDSARSTPRLLGPPPLKATNTHDSETVRCHWRRLPNSKMVRIPERRNVQDIGQDISRNCTPQALCGFQIC